VSYCPSCGDEIAAEISRCPTCDAIFGPNSAWQPLAEQPPDRDLDKIAEFRAAAAFLGKKRERKVAEPEQPAKRASVFAAVFVAAVAILILNLMMSEVVIIDVFLTMQYRPDASDRHEYGGLALGAAFLGPFVIAPATCVLALILMACGGTIAQHHRLATVLVIVFGLSAILLSASIYAVMDVKRLPELVQTPLQRLYMVRVYDYERPKPKPKLRIQ
jgi:hypothetical protein